MKGSPVPRSMRAILHAVATPVLIVSARDLLVYFVNRAAARLIGPRAHGSTVEEVFGLDDGARLTDADDHPLVPGTGPVARAVVGEEVGPLELVWRDGDRRVVLSCFAEKIAADSRAPEAVVDSLFDVTGLKKVQCELARIERRRDEFVALAAHELRTPLTCLRLQVDAAERKHPELLLMAPLRHAIDRMSNRVEQLVDVVEMREQLVVLHPEQLDLREFAGDGFRLLEAQAMWARCSVTVTPGPPIVGQWDRRRLTQIVSSLVSNAIKFGAGKPIEIVAGDEGDGASLRIVDHGVGVREADREVIFERFQRRASAAHFAGLGLDLWIALELLREMGGTIRVDDTEGGGATFTFRLPKVHLSAGALERPSRRASGPAP